MNNTPIADTPELIERIRAMQDALNARHAAHPCLPQLGPLCVPTRLATMLLWAKRVRPDLWPALSQQYLEWMPTTSLDALRTSATAYRFHVHPLSAETPKIAAILNAFDRDVEGSFIETYRTTCFGRLLPLLYGMPADFEAYANDAKPLPHILDHRLSGPLAHELCHGPPTLPLSLPPYLDECVAGALGARLTPWILRPDLGHDNGMYAAIDFAHVGEWLIERLGEDAVKQAQFTASWRSLLGTELFEALWRVASDDFLRHGQLHFLSNPAHSGPWLTLLHAGLEGEALGHVMTLEEAAELQVKDTYRAADVRYLHFVLHYAAVEHTIHQGSYRVHAVDSLKVTWADNYSAVALGTRPAKLWVPPGLREALQEMRLKCGIFSPTYLTSRIEDYLARCGDTPKSATSQNNKGCAQRHQEK